jgi:hypothetical protein
VTCARGGRFGKSNNPPINNHTQTKCMVGLRRLNKQTTKCSALLFLPLISGVGVTIDRSNLCCTLSSPTLRLAVSATSPMSSFSYLRPHETALHCNETSNG